MRTESCNRIIIHYYFLCRILVRRLLHLVRYGNYQQDILKADMSHQAHLEECGCKTKIYFDCHSFSNLPVIKKFHHLSLACAV